MQFVFVIMSTLIKMRYILIFSILGALLNSFEISKHLPSNVSDLKMLINSHGFLLAISITGFFNCIITALLVVAILHLDNEANQDNHAPVAQNVVQLAENGDH